MLFFEQYAGLGLIVHALVGIALVFVTTHLVVWMRRYPRGEYARARAVRRFALLSVVLYGATFVLGNLIYPTYKVRVRTAFLDDGSAVVRRQARRLAESQDAQRRYQEVSGSAIASPVTPPPDPAASARRAKKVARWFDVKEHWVALGLCLSLACFALLRTWRPKESAASLPRLAFVLACGASAFAWFGAIVGLITTSVRSI